MQHLGLAPTMSLIITWGFEEKKIVVVIFGVWISLGCYSPTPLTESRPRD